MHRASGKITFSCNRVVDAVDKNPHTHPNWVFKNRVHKGDILTMCVRRLKIYVCMCSTVRGKDVAADGRDTRTVYYALCVEVKTKKLFLRLYD